MVIINTYMRNYFKLLKRNSGFTLIELLVVIGILGILAAALIATIDPFEQLKKAQDANVKNTAVEFIDANIRYYTTHNAMPWVNDTAGCGGNVGGATNFSASNLNNMQTCLADLIADGELKPGFTTVTNILDQILVTGSATGVIACFNPLSKAQNHDVNTKYNSDGTTNAGCPVTSGVSSSCFWCAQ